MTSEKVTEVRARRQDRGEPHCSSSEAACGWPAGLASGNHLPPLPSGNMGTGPAWGSLLRRNRTLLPSQPEHDPEDQVGLVLRRLCSLSPSACREVALFKARTFQRGLFLTQGRPTGCEPISSHTDQTNRSASQANGAPWASNETQPTSSPSDFLGFVHGQLQVLGIQT